MLLWLGASARAIEPGVAIEELSLQELLDRDVAIATRTDQRAREAPSLVTVLTADDIARAGCRDLLDALRLIPAIEAGGDVWGTAGLGIRGNWAFESKVLVRIDGHEWSERDYGSFPLGHRLPAAAIERIEVIRGPGSAVYGGYASLAVIEVTTRAAGQESGTRAFGRASWLGSGAYGSQDIGLSGGYLLGQDGRLGFSALLGRGRRSDDLFYGIHGETLEQTDSTALDPSLLSAELQLGPWSVAAMAERYHTTHRTGFGVIQDPERDNDFEGLYLRSSLLVDLSPRWSLTPRLSGQWQRPWRSIRNTNLTWRSGDVLRQEVLGFDLRGTPHERLDLMIGAEAGLDHIRVPEEIPDRWIGESATAQYGFGAGWAQAIVSAPVQLVGGVRVDGNTSYGRAVSPRLAASYARERGHVKLLWSRAFRAPSFQQSRFDVIPERSNTVEAEGGLSLTRWAYATASLFDVRIQDTIVYQVFNDPETGDFFEGYANLGQTGSRGCEISLEVKRTSLSGSLGYAGYGAKSTAGADTDTYNVPGHPRAHLGLPNHKLVARGSLDLPHDIRLGAVATGMYSRWAITAISEAGTPVYEELSATTLDINAGIDTIAGSTLGLSLDIHDLFDVAPSYIQPYDGMHPPLPSTGREIGILLSADW